MKKKRETRPIQLELTQEERLMLYKIAAAMGNTLSGSLRSLIYEKAGTGIIVPVDALPKKPLRNGVHKKYPIGHVGNYLQMSLDHLMKEK